MTRYKRGDFVQVLFEDMNDSSKKEWVNALFDYREEVGHGNEMFYVTTLGGKAWCICGSSRIRKPEFKAI